MNKPQVNERICAVIVTYNRKNLLINCLRAIYSQSLSLEAIIIINNASTDGTFELLKAEGYLQNNLPKDDLELLDENNSNRPRIIYSEMSNNIGGAGGFYEGIKEALTYGYDWIWLMDDDGLPQEKSLEHLYSMRKRADFLNPLVVDINEHEYLSFGLFDKENLSAIQTRSQARTRSEKGLIFGVANPFNGTFISKKLVESIGLPKREMFIWGDEIEYKYRAMKYGYKVATAVNSIHYHPKGRVEKVKILNGKYELKHQTSKLKNYCDMRNSVYIAFRYRGHLSFLKQFIAYNYYFLTNLKINGYLFYMNAVIDGIFGLWGREKKFLK